MMKDFFPILPDNNNSNLEKSKDWIFQIEAFSFCYKIDLLKQKLIMNIEKFLNKISFDNNNNNILSIDLYQNDECVYAKKLKLEDVFVNIKTFKNKNDPLRKYNIETYPTTMALSYKNNQYGKLNFGFLEVVAQAIYDFDISFINNIDCFLASLYKKPLVFSFGTYKEDIEKYFKEFYDFICPEFNNFKNFSDIKNQIMKNEENKKQGSSGSVNKIL